VLGLPDEFHPIGVIPVGRPLPDKRSPSLRRGWLPFEDFAHWERW
jgi:nitroreductase